jgi:hypothetical protein
MVVNIDHQ